VRCHVAHAGERADAQAPIRQRSDPRHIGQTVDVQQTLGKHGSVLHQADEVRTARYEGEMGILSVGRDGFRRIIGS